MYIQVSDWEQVTKLVDNRAKGRGFVKLHIFMKKAQILTGINSTISSKVSLPTIHKQPVSSQVNEPSLC